MFFLVFLSLGIGIIVLQTAVLHLLPAWLGKPDILFLLVVYIACRGDMLLGALTILVLGLFMDVFSGVYLGLYPVMYLLVFSFIKGISRRIAINEFAYQIPLAVLVYLFVGIGMYLLALIMAPDSPPQWTWGTMLLQLLIIAVIGTPVFGLFDVIMNFYLSSSAAGRFLGSKRTNRFK